MKKVIAGIVIVLFAAAGIWFAATYVEVDTRGEVELPSVDVDVDAESGELPEVDVRGPDVDVRMEEKTVEVPTVSVTKPEETEPVAPN